MSDNTNYKINDIEFDDFFIKRDLFSQGGAFSFGENIDGMLGTSNSNVAAIQTTPAEIIAVGTNYRQIAVGNNFVGAVKSDGTLWMWGNNTHGQLGADNVTHRSSPIQTTVGGREWKQVSCGLNFTGAIKADGTLWMWGRNDFGQLADNTRTSRSSPIQTVSAGNNWKQVACGQAYAAAIKTDGTLWTWGYNISGQLGDNSRTNRSSPVQTAAGGTNWKQVSVGSIGLNTAAIKTDGTLWVWGSNSHGQLGDNTELSKSSPIQTISGGTNWKQVSCGRRQIAAIKTDGSLWLWGNNENGELGDETIIHRSSPVQTVAGGSSWKFVVGGYNNTAAIKTDGSLWLWGNFTGNGSEIFASSPVLQTSGYIWKTISSGGGDYNGVGDSVGTLAGITEDYW